MRCCEKIIDQMVAHLVPTDSDTSNAPSVRADCSNIDAVIDWIANESSVKSCNKVLSDIKLGRNQPSKLKNVKEIFEHLRK